MSSMSPTNSMRAFILWNFDSTAGSVMKSQGMQENQQVVFLSEGGEDIRQAREYLHPNSEHVTDWFHLTMRQTVLQQQTKALEEPQHSCHEVQSNRGRFPPVR